MRAGLRRTIRHLLDRECPNLRKSTIEEMRVLGLIVQREAPRNELPLCYPLHWEQFVDRCMELGIVAAWKDGE